MRAATSSAGATVAILAMTMIACAIAPALVTARPQNLPPGLQAALSEAGVQHVLSSSLPLIFSQLQGMHVPDLSGSQHVPIIGTVDYSVTNNVLNSVAYGSAEVTMSGALGADISGVAVSGSLSWSVRQHSWPHFSSSGTADVSFSDSGATIGIAMTATPNGTLQVAAEGVSISLQNLDIKVHGSVLSWLYDLIIDLFHNTLENVVEEKVAAALTDGIDTLGNAALSSFTYSFPVGTEMVLDFSFVSSPIFAGSYSAFPLRGEFEAKLWNGTAPPAPFPRAGFASGAPDRMLAIEIDPFLFDTALWVPYLAGDLQRTISPSEVPPNFPMPLNTATFHVLLPNLYQAFPNAALQLFFNVTSSPLITIDPTNGATMKLVADVQWSAAASNGFTEAFVMQLGVETALDMFIAQNGTHIGAKIPFVNFSMSLVRSEVGTLDLTALDAFFQFLTDPLVALLNTFLGAAPLPIPIVDGLVFVNPELVNSNGYVYISTDLNYSPPPAVHRALDELRKARLSQF